MRKRHGKEYFIQKDLIAYLKARGWLVERIIGNAFQSGLPDLYCFHPKWGERWIDVKNPFRSTFTKRQKQKWPIWQRFGVGIWILIGADQENYDKLFQPPNMMDYWKPSWKIPTEAEIDQMMEEI